MEFAYFQDIPALNKLLLLAASLAAFPAAMSHAHELPIAKQQQIVDGTEFAQAQCYHLIHHDTFEYQDCIRSLLAKERKITARRLGIEYFGWVGAINSSRMGMLGADVAARDFLKRFRNTQKKIGVSDQTLCQTIPGNCTARIARMQQMETESAPSLPQSSEKQ